MIEALVVMAINGALIVLAAGLIAVLLRHSAPARHLVWVVAFVVLCGLPLLHPWLPKLNLDWLPPTAATNTVPAPGLAPELDRLPAATSITSEAASPSLTAQRDETAQPVLRQNGQRWSRWLPTLYGLGVAFMLLQQAQAFLALWRIERRTTPAKRLALPALPSRIQVALAPVAVPMTWGLLRPRILLPHDSEYWRPAQLRRAVLHERAHVERFDWATQLIAEFALTLYWFHPLVWLARRRLLLEAERCCDDRVLRAGEQAKAYAMQLVGLARQSALRTRRSVVAMGPEPQLSARVRKILDPHQRRSVMTVPRALTVTVVSFGLMLVMASVALVPAGETRLSRAEFEGLSPLMQAAAAGDAARVRGLLRDGADPNGTMRGRGTPLILASAHGSVAVVEALLAAGADPNLTEGGGRRPHGLMRSALATAAHHGHHRIVQSLLQAGAEVDRTPRGDATALMEAAGQGHAAIVRTLIDYGAKVNRVVHGDGTALIAASRGGHADIVDLLLAEGARPGIAVDGDGNAMIQAAAAGDVETMQLLVDAGADLDDSVDGDGSPLINAVSSSSVEMVRFLVDAGADVNAAVPGDGNALIIAARGGNAELAGLLIDAGADVNAGVRGDGNPLIMAARGGHLRTVQLLLDAGADIDAGVRGDGNPLIMAAGSGRMEVVRLLVEAGADIDRVVPGDENALITSAAAGHIDVVGYLLDQGADPNIVVQTRKGPRTALNQAQRFGNDRIAQMLQAAGARR